MKTVKSVLRAIEILDCLAVDPDMTLSEIARALKAPKSTAFEIITTLLERGIIEKGHDRNRYRLGLRVFELGRKAQVGLEIRSIATPLMAALNCAVDEAVHLTVPDAGDVLYIESFQSSKSLRTYSAIGVRAPMHCTGVGKAILAFLQKDEVEQIIASKGLRRFTANTITSTSALFRELQATRERGFSIDDGEHEDGVRCVGAPIRDHTGRVVASLSISAPMQRLPRRAIPNYGRRVVAVARQISRGLGCPPKTSGADRSPRAPDRRLQSRRVRKEVRVAS
jgi:DNA-binding IclR family transcriptional regulator